MRIHTKTRDTQKKNSNKVETYTKRGYMTYMEKGHI